MTRTQNVKRNLTFNIIKFATQLMLQFLLRTVLIYIMGVEYIGLNGLFANIFQFLNLAELGIGSAIVFAMYKPIAEGDIEKVKTLQNLYKRFYLIIALVVVLVGGILTPFLNIFINGEASVEINIYVLYLMYLINAFIGYFSAHKRSLLLAYERNDLENKIKTICLLGMTIIQILVLIIFKNYYLFFTVNIVFTLLECITIHKTTNKYFPDINGRGSPLDDVEKKTITKNVVALSMHKIGSATVFSTDSILVSTFFGVVLLGAYSNYTLILSSLISLFSVLGTALTGSVGSLLASTSIDHSYKKYNQIKFIYSFICAFCTICLVVLFQPFIKVWTGGGVYLLNYSTVLILCLSFYITRMRSATWLFNDCAGLYWQNRFQPLIEAVVNLGVSVGLVYWIGIDGIFIGTIISTLVAPFWWEPYMLFKYYFKKPLKNYFLRYFLDMAIMITIGALCYFVCALLPDGGVGLFLLKFVVCVVCTVIGLILAYCWTSEFKDLYKILKTQACKLFHKDKTAD